MNVMNTPLVDSTVNESNIAYYDETGKVKYRGRICNLILTTDKTLKFIEKSTSKLIEVISLDDVIGSNYVMKRNSGVLEIYRYAVPGTKTCGSKSKHRKKSFIFVTFLVDDYRIIRSWSNAINCLANSQPIVITDEGVTPFRHKRTIVYVNPASGKGLAKKRWENVVKKMFIEAGIEVTLIITNRRNHCYDHVAALDVTTVDFITTISGDGLVYEVINGLASREDAEQVLKSLPIAAIPGGSANALSKCLTFASNEEHSLLTATFVTLKGTSTPMDLSFVQTKSNSYHSFLMLGWAFISDADILSEFLRPFIGGLRIQLAAAYFILRKRYYRGRLSMLLSDQDQNKKKLLPNHSLSGDVWPTQLPPLGEPLFDAKNPGSWYVMEENFFLVWVLQTSHTGESFYSGPGITLDDGLFTIIVANNLSRLELIRLLLIFDKGGHVKNPKVSIFKALAYRLEPLTDDGIYTLDGEVVEYGPLQAVMRPSAARVLTIPH